MSVLQTAGSAAFVREATRLWAGELEAIGFYAALPSRGQEPSP